MNIHLLHYNNWSRRCGQWLDNSQSKALERLIYIFWVWFSHCCCWSLWNDWRWWRQSRVLVPKWQWWFRHEWIGGGLQRENKVMILLNVSSVKITNCTVGHIKSLTLLSYCWISRKCLMLQGCNEKLICWPIIIKVWQFVHPIKIHNPRYVFTSLLSPSSTASTSLYLCYSIMLVMAHVRNQWVVTWIFLWGGISYA